MGKDKMVCRMEYEVVDNNVICTNKNTGTAFLIDLEDLPKIRDYSWSDNGDGYLQNRKLGRLHRLLIDCPKGSHIDHIDGNKMDCRKSNMRACSLTQNNMNVKKRGHNTSGYKGVFLEKKMRGGRKWMARIQANGVIHRLGYFVCKIEAARAYNAAALKYHGEFALLNSV
jgi:hypothetical protein